MGQTKEKFADKLVRLVIKQPPWRKIIFAFSIAAFLYVIAINFSSLQHGLIALKNSNILLLLASLLAIIVTYLTASGVYWALSDRSLHYVQMVQVEIAGAFTSRLLPAGLGGVATNLTYISKALKSKTAATTILALNNLLSIASYFIACFVVVVVFQEPVSLSHLQVPRIPPWVIISGVVLLVLLLSLVKQLRHKAGVSWHTFKRILKGYKERPSQLLLAFCFALGTTTLYLLAFYICCLALGTPITITQAVVAFTFGLAGGTVAPTPGGLGGAELGFYSGLFATGIGSSEALSIVLVYRILAFWLPLVPGFLMFRHLLKQKVL